MKPQEIKNKAKFTFIILLCLFFITSFSNVNFAQNEIIKVDTDLITVPVTVFDRDGRYISDLNKEYFQIFENGVEQEVAFFESVDKPFTVFLLLDTSDSMNSQLKELAIASNTFVSQLRPDDQIIVALFDDRIDIINEVKSVEDFRGKEKIRLQINNLAPVTMVYDAVEKALKRIKAIRGRKAIILFSDGVGSGYFANAKENLRDAEEGEALIYTIQFNTYAEIAPRNVSKKKYYKDLETADAYMQNLAQTTGGRRFQVKDISNLGKAFAQVAEELGQQYSLGYYPKNPGKKGERRQIKVKVNVPNTAVRARESYVVK